MRIRESLGFLRTFVRHPQQVGAIAPSSPILARRMVEGLVVPHGRSVIEFGPGTGAFTRAIEPILPDPATYLGIERDPGFVRVLRKRFPQLTIAEGSAEHAREFAAEHGLPPVMAILCGLPFAGWPRPMQDRVIHALEALLPPGAIFRTFTYAHSYNLPAARSYRRRMTALLGTMQRSPIVVRNLPPAFVLTWTREP